MRPPANVNPVGRPSFPSGGIAGGTRPNVGNRPQADNRPDIAARPGFPSSRPGGGGDRPSLGNVNRPTTLPGGRPTIGGGDRPIIGGGSRPGRPGIGDGNINIGNDINIGGGNVIGNRPGWDRPDWNRPDWGWGGGGWAGNWHDHCIRPHYGWYNGCWTGYWGSNWYAPLAWGAVGWGLGAWTSGWGYGSGYYNPYYTAAAGVPYDYSQPVVVNNYISSDADAGDAAAAPEDPATEQATRLFDDGLAKFKSGDYRAALAQFDAALAKLPGDPVVHEVRALTLFALGEYTPAAAALNAFLTSAPGMDWTTLSSLYGNVDDYQAQLRKLEQFCRSNPDDASAFFVLAYQYLVLGSQEDAIKALEVVVRNQPKDYTAKRMLDALAPPEETPPPVAAPAPSDAPQTDLVGTWRASAGDTAIDLTITPDSQFTWKAAQRGKPPVELKGQLASTSDQLVLESADQGAMSGSVKSLGPDKWQFALSGGPPSDPGLSFARVH